MNNEIEKSIELKASIFKVWEALVDYRKFGEWFRVNINHPFEIGKPANGAVTYPGYENVEWKAIIQDIEPKSLFSFTWHPYAVDPTKDYSEETPTLVAFKLHEVPGGTLLTVIEKGFESLPKDRKEEAYRMHEEGWIEQLRNIEFFVAHP